MSVIQIKDLQIGDIYVFFYVDNSHPCPYCGSLLNKLISRVNTETHSICYYCLSPLCLYYDDHLVQLVRTITI